MENILSTLSKCVNVLSAHEDELSTEEKEVLSKAKYALKVSNGYCYAKIYLLTDDLKSKISTEVKDDYELHFIPKVSLKKKFVLMEISIDEHGIEYYSNAMTSNSLDELQNIAEKYRSWWNYITKEALQFNGKIMKLK